MSATLIEFSNSLDSNFLDCFEVDLEDVIGESFDNTFNIDHSDASQNISVLDDFIDYLDSESLSTDDSLFASTNSFSEMSRDHPQIKILADQLKFQSIALSKKSIRKHMIFKSVPVEKIPSKSFQRITSDISREFNMGNIHAVASIINKHIHNRALFRTKNPAEYVEAVGTDPIISFYGALLHVFPDAILLTKKVKTFTHDKFYVIQSKVDFTGTQISRTVAHEVFCPDATGIMYQADFMGDISIEEKVKLIEFEENIVSNGRKMQLSIRAVMTLYLDPTSNRIVLADLKYKLLHFRAV